MQKMTSVLDFIKGNKKIAIVLVVILFFVGFFIFKKGNTTEQTIIAKIGDFKNQVSASGKVIPTSSVDLGFKSSGIVGHTYFSVGQIVKRGQMIADLDATDVKGSLEIAKANYEKVLNGATSADINVAKAEVDRAQVALDQIKIQQETLVKNAKNDLLNSGFILTTEDGQSIQAPPTISGTYLKDKEGQIIIEEYDSSGGTSFKTSGLFQTSGMASIDVPQPIGDTGLYIKYLSRNDRTKWILNIPNTQSSMYNQNLNAYQTALANKNQMIANAEANLNQAKSVLIFKQSNARPEDVSAAYGQLLVAQGAYNDKVIFAPFDGMITKMDAKVGEVVSPSTSLISMMSADTFQIESYVPEVNIAKIAIGNNASVTLDAYGEEVFFQAKVVSIDPAETIRDGVSTYKVKFQFLEKDERVRSGMTANVSIITAEKPNVIVLPQGVIFEKNNKKFIQVKKKDKNVDVEITTGNVSSLGQVEITSGVSDGDVVLLKPIIK